MDKNCAIARDLMPQVIDNVASDESRAFVEAHVAACAPCAQVYADMKNEIAGAESAAGAGGAVSFKAAVSELRKTLGWKRIRTAVIAVLITIAVFLIGYTGHYYLFRRTDLRAMPNDDYTIHLFETDYNSVYLIPQFFERYDRGHAQTTFNAETGVMYIHWTSAIIPVSAGHQAYWYPNVVMRLPLTADHTLTTSEGFAVREIRQGTQKDYVVIYQAGDTLSPLDPTMDAYIRQQEFFMAQLDAASDVLNEGSMMHIEAQLTYQEYLDRWEVGQSAQPTETPAP